jgi:hypothetical protein
LFESLGLVLRVAVVYLCGGDGSCRHD